MTHLDNMNDVEFLARKNAEITRLKLIQAGLILLVIALAITIAAIALISRFGNPTAEPSIDVIQREAFDGKDSTIRIPNTYQPGDKTPTITAGESFTYNTKGKKLQDVGGVVSYQLNCKIDGIEQLTSLGEAYSNLGRGDFNTTRAFTIPISSRLQNSDHCRLQTITTYTFYQSDQGGTLRPINVTEIGMSNEFKLRIPEDVEPDAGQTSGAVGANIKPVIPNQPPATAAPTPLALEDNDQPTTSGGPGGDDNNGSDEGSGAGNPDTGGEEERQSLLEVDLPLLPPIKIL